MGTIASSGSTIVTAKTGRFRRRLATAVIALVLLLIGGGVGVGLLLTGRGGDDATEAVTGPALDFCLVVTQRRHVDDTDLVVEGDAASDWMRKAQAFAGPPTDGPPAR